MNTNKALYIILLGSLILGFQNCSSEVGFSNESGGGLLTEKNATAGIIPMEIEEPETISDNNDDIDVNSDDEETSTTPNEEATTEDSPHNYICILEGPGFSVKIGYIDGQLLEKNATPKSVCMSQEACTEIISQKFAVTRPAKRGYCHTQGSLPANPHVVEMSDAQLQALVDAI